MSCIEHFCDYGDISDFPEHKHTSCEILYLKKGHISLVCGDEKLDVIGGMIYVIPSGISHRMVIKNHDHYDRTLIFLNPWTYTRSYYSDLIYNITMGFSTDKPLIVEADETMKKQLDIIKSELLSEDLLSEDIIVSSVTLLLSNIIRKLGITITDNKKPNKLVVEVQRFIQENYRYPIMISDIAENFFISKYYLSHVFKEQTGMAPKSFLTLTRVTKAYNMLHDSDARIADISEKCGFSNTNDMINKFKQQYGVSPAQFRKQILNKSKF